MHTSLRRLVLAGLGFLALVVAFAPPAQALPAPSKTDAGQALLEREADLATLDALLDNEEVSEALAAQGLDRKSTRLNSSHSQISYAVFCLKKKKNNESTPSAPSHTGQPRPRTWVAP